MKRIFITTVLGSFLLLAFLGLNFIFSNGGLIWEKIETPSKPIPPRGVQSMVYDSLRHKVILFGGAPANDVGLNDLWDYDGTNWIQKFPLNTPPTRYYSSMVYDKNRSVIVLFGGEDWPNLYNDTWEYNGIDWEHIDTPHKPITRHSWQGMAYDSWRGKVVLFGGWHWYTFLGDTWEYDGTDWNQKNPSISPSARRSTAMAFDENRGIIVLFGGTSGSHLNDTWEWDGENWHFVNTANNPGPRHDHQLIYDSDRKTIILFGGHPIPLNDIWEYDGNDWSQIETINSPELSGYSIVYCQERQNFVLFGGLWDSPSETYVDNETWELGSLTLTIDIDIKPGSYPNSINPNSKGVIPVAILTTEDFDATTVNGTTVNFGPGDAEPVHYALEDVDWDGDLDMIFHFRTKDTEISCGDTSASLKGKTIDNEEIINIYSRLIILRSFTDRHIIHTTYLANYTLKLHHDQAG